MKTTASRSKIISLVVAALVAVMISMFAFFMLANKGAPVAWGWWGPVNEESGIALYGYDPVAYHTNEQSLQGDKTFGYQWNNVTWLFSSAQNKTLFQNNPEKYAPEYGGYCATAVSWGITFETDPKVWHIKNDKLYLFFDDGAKQDWLSGIDSGVITKGNTNWATRPAN